MRVLLAALAVLCSGCCIFRGKGQPEYSSPVVYGERVFVISPGSTVVVPPLKQPACKWYLVDDVGLSMWLGIPYDTILESGNAYDQAMAELDRIEAETEGAE
jgi:hypothetical protein